MPLLGDCLSRRHGHTLETHASKGWQFRQEWRKGTTHFSPFLCCVSILTTEKEDFVLLQYVLQQCAFDVSWLSRRQDGGGRSTEEASHTNWKTTLSVCRHGKKEGGRRRRRHLFSTSIFCLLLLLPWLIGSLHERRRRKGPRPEIRYRLSIVAWLTRYAI